MTWRRTDRTPRSRVPGYASRTPALRRSVGSARGRRVLAATDLRNVVQRAGKLRPGLLHPHQRHHGAADDEDETDPVAEAVALVHSVVVARPAAEVVRHDKQRKDRR